MDIVPVTIIIDGRKCKGIIDLINSNGLYLKFFYFFNSNVRSVIIETRGYMIQEIYTCLICSEVPYPHSLYYILWVPSFSINEETHIGTEFPSPNITHWILLERSFGLEVEQDIFHVIDVLCLTLYLIY